MSPINQYILKHRYKVCRYLSNVIYKSVLRSRENFARLRFRGHVSSPLPEKRSCSGPASLRSGKSGTSRCEESYMGVILSVMSSINTGLWMPYNRCKFHSVNIWLVELSLNNCGNLLAELCSTLQHHNTLTCLYRVQFAKRILLNKVACSISHHWLYPEPIAELHTTHLCSNRIDYSPCEGSETIQLWLQRLCGELNLFTLSDVKQGH